MPVAVLRVDRTTPAPGAPVDASWAELTQVALLGTSRRGLPAPARTGRLHLDEPRDEVALLGAASSLGAWRSAGPLALDLGAAAIREAPVDPRPAPTAQAAQLLRFLVDGNVKVGDAEALIVHWLVRAAATGHRLGHAELVPLLSWGSADRERRRWVRPVLGTRGAWLAEGSEQWAWAVGADDGGDPADAGDLAGRFATATKDRRGDLLREVRSLDPGLGRELLDEARRSDGAPARVELLRAFEAGLAADDEPLLEEMLDDRAASVRGEVAALLSRLPTSRYGQRMRGRLSALVHDGRRSIEVALPAALDDAAARDGLVLGDGPGERGAARAAIVAAAPLSAWAAYGQPADVVRKVEDEVLVALTTATLRQRDATWALALLNRGPSLELLQVVAERSKAEAVRHAVDSLRRIGGDDRRRTVLRSLAAIPGPWPADLSAGFVDLLREEKDPWRLQQHLALGPNLDPSALGLLDAWLARIQGDEQQVAIVRSVRTLRTALDLRAAIDAAFP